MLDSLIFDTHAHYNSHAFEKDRDELLTQLPQKGVCGVINAGTTLEDSLDCIRLAEQYKYCYAAAGIHPEDALVRPENWLEQLEELLKRPKVVAVGEIGLDYHYEDACPREIQKEVFEEQLKLAQKLNLPVIVHDREAHGDTMELLRKYRPRGVLHCFSGSAEMATEYIKLGATISIAGPVTYKNNRKTQKVVQTVPMEHLLAETDAPYLTPEPFRGKTNKSPYVEHTVRRIALLKEMEYEDAAKATYENARRFFGI